MKKNLSLVVCIVLLVSVVLLGTGCNKKKFEADKYFHDYASQGGFSTAQKTLTLGEKTSIYSYDSENDIFVTFTRVLNNYGTSDDPYMYLFGIATATEELVTPRYAGVVAINGDYAIVTKPDVKEDTDGKPKLTPSIGVVKFRGDNQGDLTLFNVPHDQTYNQFAFVGDYIVSTGIKDMPTNIANFSTFYEYKKFSKMLEVFRVRCGSEYSFIAADNYISAIGKDHAFFFQTSDLKSDGFLTVDERGIYLAFPEDTEGKFTDSVVVDIFYLGNGWFTRTGKLESTKAFDGYNMIYQKSDPNTGEVHTMYALVRCDLYNAVSRSSTDKEWLVVDSVANRYTADYYAQMTAYLNNLSTYDEERERYEYSMPYFDPSAMIKDGYSIVYYYYFPYADEGNFQSEITFCLMDEQANIINLKELLMPPMYIDGMGVETSDPLFEKYYGGVYYLDKNYKRTELSAYVGGEKTYATYLHHSGGVLASEINYQNNSILYGMVSPTNVLLIDYMYLELSPFYGDYAIGTRSIQGAYKTYRLDRSGTETELRDAVNVRQGVYVYQQSEKLGLKNYAGTVLIDAEYDELEVFEVFMQSGQLQLDYAMTKKGETVSLYRVN